jgi:hypothetical protein
MTEHTITTVEESGNSVVRECACGWVTVGEIPEPAHHTPLAVREQTHFDEVAKIADGTVWDEVPDRYTLTVALRRRLRGQAPNDVVINAVWLGDFRTVALFPWTPDGLGEAATWIDAHGGAVWSENGRLTGSPVDTAALHRHAA